MPKTPTPVPDIKLTICITTFNRASFIGATIESVIEQLTDACELLILDGGSTDDTPRVVSSYLARYSRLRYIRQEENNGWDRDCDQAVRLSNGEYCWLMTDDDLFKPNAIDSVLGALQQSFSAVIVNVEARTFDMSRIVEERCLPFHSDREYDPADFDKLFGDLGGMLTYVGEFVVKRSIWLQRSRERYYGSLFIHVGVIFQEPLPGRVLVLSNPLIVYRMGNAHTWSAKTFHTFVVSWPTLVWSLQRSESAKMRASPAEPWRGTATLLRHRGRGSYSMKEYRGYVRHRVPSIHQRLIPMLIALLPGVLVNFVFLIYFSAFRSLRRGVWLQFMKESPYCFLNWPISQWILNLPRSRVPNSAPP